MAVFCFLAVVLGDIDWDAACCGVIVGWKMRAGKSGKISVQTWTIINEIDRIANMQDAMDVDGEPCYP